MSINKIPHNDLIEIFNNVLNSCRFIIDVPELGFYLRESESYPYKEDKNFKTYLDKKQTDIEYKLDVFKNIPSTDIYRVVEDFIHALIDYNHSIVFKKMNTKKLQKESYNLRQKDIKVIKAYQEMIFNYTSDYGYNDDEDYSILNPMLDDIYQTNKQLLHELETKDYKILDVFRYGGTNLYDSTKKPLKHFFKELQNEYSLKTNNIKQMIDIL